MRHQIDTTIMPPYDFTFLLITTLSLVSHTASNHVMQLMSTNVDGILKSNEIVFMNFYADWCRFSQMLTPIFEDAARKVKEEFPQEGRVVFGRVDCERETAIAAQYHVNKYPTLKIFRHGSLVKREYRGQRSADAMSTFIKEQLRESLEFVENLDSLDSLDRKKRHIIGYFDSHESPDMKNFQTVSNMLKDDCVFHAAVGPVSQNERIAGNKMLFKPMGDLKSDMLYTGPLSDYSMLLQWTQDKCVPLVREITFENAEELTEEGLPFMILFHQPDDQQTPDTYRSICARELLAEKSSVNFLTADGLKFTHPLYHLGKTANDLPILAIDSFRHMYIWKQNPKTDLEKPGLLKEFIADLHSGKLHREFHHGPDPDSNTGTATETKAVAAAVARQRSAEEDAAGTLNFNVQQQVIMHSDGVRVQVVRLVQVGGPRQQVDLREHLQQLGAGTTTPTRWCSWGWSVTATRAAAAATTTTASRRRRTRIPDDGAGDDRDPSMDEDGLLDDEQQQQHISAADVQARHHHQEEPRISDGQRRSTSSTVNIGQLKVKLPNDKDVQLDRKSPPDSIFRKLAPSDKRYTILKDEL